MCGIFGYIGEEGKSDPAELCMQGLHDLAYRGYDSTGIAAVSKEGLHICKQVGQVEMLELAWKAPRAPLSLAIAHTRWATHGKPSYESAHPHVDHALNLAIVHNGIIENYIPLREMLLQKGIPFRSPTDSEVIAQLISYFYAGDLLRAAQKALSLLEGFWGIALIHKDHPGEIIAAAKENPLAIAQNRARKEVFLSSDPNAFPLSDLDVLFLGGGEIARIKNEQVELFDEELTPIFRAPQRLVFQASSPSKEGFDHFMLKEIFDQPKIIEQALQRHLFGEEVRFDTLSLSRERLRAIQQIVIFACGTAWHAGCLAATFFEKHLSIPARAIIASEFQGETLAEGTLLIAISQSGETLDTLTAVREARREGVAVLAICNTPHSTLVREVEGTIFQEAGLEISVCSTKAFTSQITLLLLFSLYMEQIHHPNRKGKQPLLQELPTLPTAILKVLGKQEEIAKLAKKYAPFGNFFFLGRHYMYTTALEGALKLKEISYLNATGYAAGEMKHGPIALVSPELVVIGLCGNRKTHEKTLNNLSEIKAREGKLLIFAFDQGCSEVEKLGDDTLYLPETSDELAVIPFSVASQLFAYYIAKERKSDIDRPRNLAKSVTVK